MIFHGEQRSVSTAKMEPVVSPLLLQYSANKTGNIAFVQHAQRSKRHASGNSDALPVLKTQCKRGITCRMSNTMIKRERMC